MNHGPLIFLGAFLTFASAWLGLVFFPNQQLKDLQPQAVEGSAMVNPRPYTARELAGRDVYVAEGCSYCHTQQVRGGEYNADLQRGWGPRRSDPQDYVHDNPVLLGTMRTGPDLVNVGARFTGEAGTRWHYLHLFNPQRVSPGSTMAPFRFLFETRKVVGEPAADALRFPADWTAADGAPEAGHEVVPTDRARALVAYLAALDRTYEIAKK